MAREAVGSVVVVHEEGGFDGPGGDGIGEVEVECGLEIVRIS